MTAAGHQEIKCSVRSCRFNDQTRYCTLSDITVGQDGAPGEAKSKKDTICASFAAE